MPDDSKRAVEPRLDGLRVLVVDDYADARDLFTFLLTKSGAGVTTAASAAEAMIALARQRFHALLSDVHMPEESGLDLIRRVRRSLDVAALPAVAVTADRDPGLRSELLDAGFQRCLRKPVDIDELISTVREIVV